MHPANPYAPPHYQDAPPPGEFNGFGNWQQDGRAVLYTVGAMLPHRCVVCNAPGKHRVYKTFMWHEPWLYALIPAGLIVYAIAAAIMRKTAGVEYWLCDQHRSKRTWGLVLAWAGFFVGFFGMLFAAAAEQGYLALFLALLMIVLPIVGGMMARTARPARITDSEVWLKAGAPFVASLPYQPQTGSMGYGVPAGAIGYGAPAAYGPPPAYGSPPYGPPPGYNNPG